MRRSSLGVSGVILAFTVALTGCASATIGGRGADEAVTTPAVSSEPTTYATDDAAALAQAQEWLEAATLPAGAVRTENPSASFNSYTGWPCGPYEELKGYWVIPDATVVDAANWLIQNPTADLITTAVGPTTEEWGPVDSATVGYVPAVGSQEGIVYTLAKSDEGVAVRAEVAAQTDSATCPPLPDGGMYGAPGQG
jgi:hypothetical protein